LGICGALQSDGFMGVVTLSFDNDNSIP
jgi:hypothetical protein